MGRLNVVFDDNRITIDGPTQLATTDDVGQRFEAYGWHVEYLGEIADDCDALEAALLDAKTVEDRPSLLIVRSHIGTPSPGWTDNHEAHGNPFTAADVTATKEILGIPDEPFWSPPSTSSPPIASLPANAAPVSTSAGTRHSRRRNPTNGRNGRPPGVAGVDGWRRRCRRSAEGEKVGHVPGDRQGARRLRRLLPRTVSGAADRTGTPGRSFRRRAETAETPGGRET